MDPHHFLDGRTCAICYDTEEMDPSFHGLTGCGHHFHRKCLRENIRHTFSRPGRKTVDTEGRKVVFMRCPLCRRPVPPEELRSLQSNRSLVSLDLTAEEVCPGVALPRAMYSVNVRTRRGGVLMSVAHQEYRSEDLPVLRLPDGRTRRMMYLDTVVEAEFPAQTFVVVAERRLPSHRYICREEFGFGRPRTLRSLETDAGEEEALQREIERDRSQNELRVVTKNTQRREFLARVEEEQRAVQIIEVNNPILRDLLSNERLESSSPPLPSLNELFHGGATPSPPALSPNPPPPPPPPVLSPNPPPPPPPRPPPASTTAPRPRAEAPVAAATSAAAAAATRDRLFPSSSSSSEEEDYYYSDTSVSEEVVFVRWRGPVAGSSTVPADDAYWRGASTGGSSTVPADDAYWRGASTGGTRAATATTTAPGTTAARGRRRKKTDQERREERRGQLAEREGRCLAKIKRSLGANLRQFEALRKNVERWRDVRRELRGVAPNDRERERLRSTGVAKNLNELYGALMDLDGKF